MTFAFLFDLDGTLILTDDIYYNIWEIILKDYNITLTTEIFNNYIQGNNDNFVINSLLKNIKISSCELSKIKDKLFLEHIDNIKVIDGAIEFIKKLKDEYNYPCCIVTNCNSIISNIIIEKIGLNNYIEFIISSDICINAKPHPEPYLNAMKKLNISNNDCFIFEDSKTGILSGLAVNPKCLIGVETIYNSNNLINYGVNITIKDYTNIDITNLINNSNDNINAIRKNIIKNSYIDVQNLIINETKIKGGYIADVVNVKIQMNNKIYDCILKMENKSTNLLSFMANKLELYEREYYFYENISKYVNIKIPKFLCLMKDSDCNNCGIIMENLSIRNNFKLNLNLNVESIEISLNIINNMAKMHSKFWNKNLTKLFPKLYKNNDRIFKHFIKNFMMDKINIFKNKWCKILSANDLNKCYDIINNFDDIQENLSNNNLTLVHGDIKSPNIFYDCDNNSEPYFLDWQHSICGKGVQDLIFFIIESFDAKNIYLLYDLFKNYYYRKIVEYGVTNYSYEEYNKDLKDALYYTPFFTAIWFGSVPDDELIDKNWIYFFIQKLFIMINLI